MADVDAEILDCHIHLYDNSKYYYPWPTPDLTAIYRPFLLQDLECEMRGSPVRKAVFIQCNQTYEETDWILNYPDPNNTIAAIVGWVDIQDPQIETVLDKYMRFSKFKGIRLMLVDKPDVWIEQPEVLRGLEFDCKPRIPDFQNSFSPGVLEKKGLTCDLLIRQRHFKMLCNIVERFPKLKFVVNHMAKPDIKDGNIDNWKEGISELAKNANVYCKISGMDPGILNNWTVDDLRPYVKHVLSAFGVKRCVYGSDWPVCILATGTYSNMYQAYSDCMDHLTQDERDAVFCKNGWKLYNIK